MNLETNITINVYSIILLTVIYIHSLKHTDKVSSLSKLYMMIIRVTIMLLFIDIFSRFDGKAGTIYPLINHSGNFLIFLLSPLLPSLWFVYVHMQLFENKLKTRKWVYSLITLNIVQGILVILNLFYGWFYTIDSNNIYHRGPLFLMSVFFSMVVLLMAFGMIIFNRKKIKEKNYYSLLFFVIPPGISVVLQICIYGSSIMLNSVVFSILIVFLNIQNESIYTDHLTCVYNRKSLDKYLKEMIVKSNHKKTFSAIMLDLDDFKGINDEFGHDCGDAALRTTVRIIKKSIKSNDFIARYGGDEFWIVLNISTQDELLGIVENINRNLFEYNQVEAKNYKLGLSMGYAVYQHDSKMKVEEFQKYLDELMYKDKKCVNEC